MSPTIHVRRVHDGPSPDDGARILVDRLWPRGVSKQRAALDHWAKECAPSNELRKWFHGPGGDWPGFEARYRLELQDAPLDDLLAACRGGPVTLLTAVKALDSNHATVLRDVLMTRLG